MTGFRSNDRPWTTRGNRRGGYFKNNRYKDKNDDDGYSSNVSFEKKEEEDNRDPVTQVTHLAQKKFLDLPLFDYANTNKIPARFSCIARVGDYIGPQSEFFSTKKEAKKMAAVLWLEKYSDVPIKEVSQRSSSRDLDFATWLNSYCQKQHRCSPTLTTEGSPGNFIGVVEFQDQVYKTKETYTTSKIAKMEACKIAFVALRSEKPTSDLLVEICELLKDVILNENDSSEAKKIAKQALLLLETIK